MTDFTGGEIHIAAGEVRERVQNETLLDRHLVELRSLDHRVIGLKVERVANLKMRNGAHRRVKTNLDEALEMAAHQRKSAEQMIVAQPERFVRLLGTIHHANCIAVITRVLV